MAVREKQEMGSGLDIKSNPAEANHHGAHDEKAKQEKDQQVDLLAKDDFDGSKRREPAGQAREELHGRVHH